MRLPVPGVVPGSPIQVNARALPARGIGLVIATDPDSKLTPGKLAGLPLPAPTGGPWVVGSALAGEPYLATLWFRIKGGTFVATVKVGSGSDSADMRALASIVRSLRT